jgi:hypothetical protein
MKLLKSLTNKFYMCFDAFFDKKRQIIYDVLKDDLDNASNLNRDVLIVNDFSGYPDRRPKTFKSFRYYCSRDAILDAISGVSACVIIVISCESKETSEVRRLCDYYFKHCSVLLLTNNVGQDIGAYASALHFCKKKGVVAKFATLLNTSQFYKQDIMKSFIESPIQPGAIVGLSYGVGPRFCIIKHTHIQSFAIKTEYSKLGSIFGYIVKDMKFFKSKYRLIYFGEIWISKIAFKSGLVPYIFDGRVFKAVQVVASIFHYDHREYIFRNLKPPEE